MTKKELINYWIESSDKDYDTMIFLKDERKNTYCLFLGYLVIEDLLNGLYIKNNPKNSTLPKYHNLLLLSKEATLDVPNKMKDTMQILNHFNIDAMYDYKIEFSKNCTDIYTDEQVRNIEEIRNWLKSILI